MPVYRQIIDPVRSASASGVLVVGDQLSTVTQLAVNLAINRNTVLRVHRELERGELIETHQGIGTFVSVLKLRNGDAELQRQLKQIASDTLRGSAPQSTTLKT